jgi:hypothetical protein
MIPRRINDEAALAIAMKAHELGVQPMQAFQQIHVINGVPSCSAQLMLSLAYKRLSEFEFEITTSTDEVCEARMRRTSKKPWVALRYTYAQAQKAKLTGKDNWQNHPDDMLRNRVVSKLLKMVAPDTFAGVYDIDEAESIAPHVESNTSKVAELLGVTDESAPAEGVPFHEKMLAMGRAEDAIRDEASGPVVVEGTPQESAPEAETSVSDVAMDDWRMGLDQADTPEALAAQVDAIESDMRLDLMSRGVLLGHADDLAKERGWADSEK